MIFPPALAPPAPFPLVTASSLASEFVAPGITRATYRLATSAGPLVVHIVAIDLHEPSVRVGVVTAGDRLISQGETVSSMAARSGAVAGVNGDYFDIGQTNQPLNVVVRDGALLRTPSRRAALGILRDRTVRFGPIRFAGSVRYGAVSVPLTGVDEWPPQGGATLVLAAYGVPPPAARVSVAELQADSGAGEASAYRVVAVGDANGATRFAPPLLGFGPAAQALAAPPQLGDEVTLETALDPPLDRIDCAIGGGPLLVAGGEPVDDSDAPAPEERDRRFPVSGAAVAADGTLVLIAVDGRSPLRSVGLTRPEFGALMRGLGASDGMAFDSGGSATLVARVLGDDRPSVLNEPSDGVERPVADGFFAYSDAPRGRNPRLIVRPSQFTALPGASVDVSGAIVDDAGHRLRAARVAAVAADTAPGAHVAIARADDGLEAEVPYEVVTSLAGMRIEPAGAELSRGERIRFRAHGVTAGGVPVELGGAVQWKARNGTIDAAGIFVSGTHDASVTAEAGGQRANVAVLVGSHVEAMPLFSAQAARWRFDALPSGGAGGVEFGPQGELVLHYDFTGSERAAYARGDLVLPGHPLSLALDVRGDGGGVALRAAFVNRFGERRVLTLATHVDWRDWRRVEVAVPVDVTPPVMLSSIYAIPALAGAPARVSGALAFRDLQATLAGTP